MGSKESKGGVFAATKDENTVMFVKRAKMAEEIKTYIEGILSNKGQTQVAATTSGADEILKYKELLDQGIITEEEFQAKKNNY